MSDATQVRFLPMNPVSQCDRIGNLPSGLTAIMPKMLVVIGQQTKLLPNPRR